LDVGSDGVRQSSKPLVGVFSPDKERTDRVISLLAGAVEVRVASSGAAAVGGAATAFREVSLDAILVDWPTISTDMLAHVSALREASPGCSLILIVPDSAPSLGLSAVEAGADDYLLASEATADALRRRIICANRRRSVLEARVDRLQRRNEELDRFAHMVAHDLRNPLALIATTAQALIDQLDQLDRDMLRKHLGVISRTGHQACDVIEALLLLASVSHTTVHPQPVNMGAVLARAVRRLTPRIEESGARLEAPEEWPTVTGCAPWIEEIWVNYLDNALTHGGRPPRVDLGWQIDGEDAHFTVTDNGAGIPLERQQHLFGASPISQRDRSTGHGLGLLIVRDIVQKLGGSVDVLSAPGRGTTFSFTLPLADEDPRSGRVIAEASDP
jgi:signal transduction histidine kinase